MDDATDHLAQIGMQTCMSDVTPLGGDGDAIGAGARGGALRQVGPVIDDRRHVRLGRDGHCLK